MSEPHPAGYVPVFHEGFNAHVGPILRKPGDGGAADHFLFRVESHHLNYNGFVHGGMMMALADVVLGCTATEAAGAPCSGVSLNCDFVAAGCAGDLIEGAAQVDRKTRTMVFVSGDLYVTGRDGTRRTLLTATGIWKIPA